MRVFLFRSNRNRHCAQHLTGSASSSQTHTTHERQAKAPRAVKMASREFSNQSKYSSPLSSWSTVVPLGSAGKLWPAASLPKMVLW